MTSDETLTELAERLDKAVKSLHDLARDTRNERERGRLMSKAEGVMLAKGYLTEMTTDPDACRGGNCKDINQMCSKHSWSYQMHYGRAANE